MADFLEGHTFPLVARIVYVYGAGLVYLIRTTLSPGAPLLLNDAMDIKGDWGAFEEHVRVIFRYSAMGKNHQLLG